MRKQILITVASAALIAGMASASAQAPDKGGNADRGAPTKAQETPKAAPGNAQSAPKGEAPAVKAEQRAAPAADKSGDAKSAQGTDKAGADKAGSKASSSGATTSQPSAANDKQGSPAARTQAQGADKAGASGTAQSGSGQTTGQAVAPAGRAGAAVHINDTQRTRIKQTINIASAPKVTNVNFSITVGTKVPRDRVQFRPLPATIVEIVPEYRGYLFFVVDDRIIIVDPNSYEIVLIIT